MLQEMVRECIHNTGDGPRLQTYYRRWSETTDILQEMVRDYRHATGDGQRLHTCYRRWSETAYIIQEMVRDCRHTTGDCQRLQTCFSSCWRLEIWFRRHRLEQGRTDHSSTRA
ncbi:unnamed protein product, partial [Staurois parvus]